MRRQYYAVLVTTEAKHYFGWLSDYLCAEADTPPRIDWEARDTSVLLPLRDSLVFRRHFALCLVQKEVWESTHIRLVDKFADQPFWDYYGKPNSYTVQQTWTDDEIVKINGIQSLGLIRSDGNVLQELSNCKFKPSSHFSLAILQFHCQHDYRSQSASPAVDVPQNLVELCRLCAVPRRARSQRAWGRPVSRHIPSAGASTRDYRDSGEGGPMRQELYRRRRGLRSMFDSYGLDGRRKRASHHPGGPRQLGLGIRLRRGSGQAPRGWRQSEAAEGRRLRQPATAISEAAAHLGLEGPGIRETGQDEKLRL